MNTIFSNWNLMRVVRLALGVFIIGEGVNSHDWSFILLGGVFTLMPIFNIGCCANNSCQTSLKKNNTDANSDEVTFEEVK